MFKKEGFKSTNLDAEGDIFFARQLEFVQSRVYEYQYPELMSYRLFPVNTNFPVGAEYITTTGYQSVGRARVINSYADDLPAAALIGMQLSSKVQGIGASYRYSYQEIRNAQYANVPLESALAMAARRAIEQKMDDLAFFGDSSVGLYGLFNNPNIPTQSVPADGTGGSTEWSTKTPDQILRDMNLIVNQIATSTNGVEAPNTLLLPLEQYTLIASMARSANSDTTVLDYFRINNPFIDEVIPVPKLAGAGLAGVDIMIAYERSSDKVEMAIPMPFLQHAPQERNLEFVINCEARFGGIRVLYPMSMIIGEGI